MTFEEYLISKKIDLNAFWQHEQKLVEQWRVEFEQMHPKSFTAQKLYLINPIRRKYTLADLPETKIEPGQQPVGVAENITEKSASEEHTVTPSGDDVPKPVQPSRPARPVFKPKPKMN